MEFELEAIHLTTLLVTAVAILYADHQGFGYFRGTRMYLTHRFVTWSHWIVFTGLCGMILSGFFLALPDWEYWITEPTFLLKMGFVLTLSVNAFLIGKLSKLTTERAFAELPSRLQKTLLVSGVVSAIGWIGAATIGFFFF